MQITKAIPGKMYSYSSRWSFKDSARLAIAVFLRAGKHAYYAKVQEKGDTFFDVRVEN